MRIKVRRSFVVLTFLTLLGAASLYSAYNLANWVSPQHAYYNLGLELYKQGNAEGAIQAFDRSLAYWRASQNDSWMERLLYPGGSEELAAEAHAKKGVLYLMMQKPELAVLSLKESIKLNPGDSFTGEGLTFADAQRLREQSFVPKYNLELLFKKNPSQAAKEGKGQGKPGNQPGDKPVPGNDPGRLPGRGNRNQI